MRVILIGIVALLAGCGLLIGNESWASQETDRPSQRFTVSKQGTLLELTNADGKGPKKLTGDGFKLNYKTRGKTQSVSAIGMKTKQLGTSSEAAKYDGNKATAVVQTADKSLEITSELIFDATAGELIIKRKFRNISKHPVILQKVLNYIDPNVVDRDQFDQSADLVLGKITAGLAVNPPIDCRIGQCPVPPICRACPPDRLKGNHPYLPSSLDPSKKEVILRWSEQITLKPRRAQQSGDEVSIDIRVVMK